MRRHYELLVDAFKASSDRIPQRNYKSTDVFDEEFISTLKRLDFRAEANTIPPRPWWIYLQQSFEEFRRALNRSVASYGAYLEASVLDLIEQLLNSWIMILVIDAVPASLDEAIEQPYGGRSPSDQFVAMRDPLHDYLDAFSGLVDWYNDMVPEHERVRFPSTIWLPPRKPGLGSARVSQPSMEMKDQND